MVMAVLVVVMMMVMVVVMVMIVVMRMVMMMVMVMLMFVAVLMVMMMLMLMRMDMVVGMGVARVSAVHIAAGDVAAFLFLAVDVDVHVGAPHAGGGLIFPLHLDAGQAQAVHARHDGIGRGQQLGKGGGQHVAGGAHGALQIQNFHAFLCPPIWLMRLASTAAPKPLSILTTPTPLAQLLSMFSRADTPPKFAP